MVEAFDADCRTSFDNESRTTLGECDREGAWIHALIDNDRPPASSRSFRFCRQLLSSPTYKLKITRIRIGTMGN
jgi:hypothetical protein